MVTSRMLGATHHDQLLSRASGLLDEGLCLAIDVINWCSHPRTEPYLLFRSTKQVHAAHQE